MGKQTSRHWSNVLGVILFLLLSAGAAVGLLAFLVEPQRFYNGMQLIAQALSVYLVFVGGLLLTLWLIRQEKRLLWPGGLALVLAIPVWVFGERFSPSYEPQELDSGDVMQVLLLFIFASVFLLLIALLARWAEKSKEKDHDALQWERQHLVRTKILDSSASYTAKTDTSDALSRAVVGGALFGRGGAVLGAATAEQKITEHRRLTFRLWYDNGTVTEKTVSESSKECALYLQFLQ